MPTPQKLNGMILALALGLAMAVVIPTVIYIQSHRFAASSTQGSSWASSKLGGKSTPESKDKEVPNAFGKPATVKKTEDGKAISANPSTPAPVRSEIDVSVVGQPFQISVSVREGCKGDDSECPLVMASVAKMVAEPRDIAWAEKMEEKIQAAVDMQGPGKYVIRNLECRTSTCVLEVEIRVPEPFPRYQDLIDSALRPHAAVTGLPEYQLSGESYRVELMDFARR